MPTLRPRPMLTGFRCNGASQHAQRIPVITVSSGDTSSSSTDSSSTDSSWDLHPAQPVPQLGGPKKKKCSVENCFNYVHANGVCGKVGHGANECCLLFLFR